MCSLVSDPRAEITGLIVDSMHRGDGVGRLLVERGEAWAREKRLRAHNCRAGLPTLLREHARRFYLRLPGTPSPSRRMCFAGICDWVWRLEQDSAFHNLEFISEGDIIWRCRPAQSLRRNFEAPLAEFRYRIRIYLNGGEEAARNVGPGAAAVHAYAGLARIAARPRAQHP